MYALPINLNNEIKSYNMKHPSQWSFSCIALKIRWVQNDLSENKIHGTDSPFREMKD